jgi:hypothetical protein
MRKTIILAIATMFLASASVVTGVIRTVDGPLGNTTLANLVVGPHAIGSLTARIFKSI